MACAYPARSPVRVRRRTVVHRFARALTLLGAVATMTPAAARAGRPVETLRAASSSESHITVESSQVLPKWTPSAGLLTAYGQAVGPTGDALRIDRRTTSHLLLALGLFDWTEIDLALPLILHQQGQTQGGGVGHSIQASAIGDLRAGLKGTILRAPRRGFGLGLSFDVIAPTGDQDALAGTGGVGYAPQILFEHRLAGAVTLGYNVGYLARPDLNEDGVVFGDAITYRAAARIPLSPRRNVALVAEIDGAAGLVRGAAHPVSLRGGLRIRARSGLVVGMYGGGAPVAPLGVPAVEAMLGIGYAPAGRVGAERAFAGNPRPPATVWARRHERGQALRAGPEKPKPAPPGDPDRDGLLATADRCPNVAEDRDGFEDGDGCPEHDNDRDGVRDPLDLCPTSPELVNGYADWDGCPDTRHADGTGVTHEVFDPAQILPHLAFAPNSAQLEAETQAQLAELAELLRLNPWIGQLEIGVLVHASGSPTEDRALATRRARALGQFLAGKGLEPWRIRFLTPKSVPGGRREGVRLAVGGKPTGLRPLAPAPEMIERMIAEAGGDEELGDKGVMAQGPPEGAGKKSGAGAGVGTGTNKGATTGAKKK